MAQNSWIPEIGLEAYTTWRNIQMFSLDCEISMKHHVWCFSPNFLSILGVTTSCDKLSIIFNHWFKGKIDTKPFAMKDWRFLQKFEKKETPGVSASIPGAWVSEGSARCPDDRAASGPHAQAEEEQGHGDDNKVVSWNRGTPKSMVETWNRGTPKSMVERKENPIVKRMIWGHPHFRKSP